MKQRMQRILAVGMLLGGSYLAQGFSLIGELGANGWQVQAIGYQLPGDIGAPMNVNEEYRWNLPTITYAYDQSFLNYFGVEGVRAVEAAIKVITNVPPVSQLSQDLSEYPLDNKRANYTAQALGIMDLKSTTLSVLLELMGLAEPERWAWCLRDRSTYTINNVTYTNYLVVQRNFDPVTYVPTNAVNGILYGYQVMEPLLPGNHADAIERLLDPVALVPYSSVASGWTYLDPGWVFTGLTRDDVGGLRYLMRDHNYNVEPLPAGAVLYTAPTNAVTNLYAMMTNSPWWIFVGQSNIYTNVINTNIFWSTNPPWTIWPGPTNAGTNLVLTNIAASNLVIQAALRPGLEKLRFLRTTYDSLLGQGFVTVTNVWTDSVVSNYVIVTQRVQRVVTAPDILFAAQDLGTVMSAPVLLSRGVQFVNNDAINGNTPHAGPGNLGPPARITFTDILPGFENTAGIYYTPPTDANAYRTMVWGSFQPTADAPIIVYPSWFSLQELEALILQQ